MKVRAWDVDIWVIDDEKTGWVHDREYTVSGADIHLAIEKAIKEARKDNKVSIKFEARSATLVSEVEVE